MPRKAQTTDVHKRRSVVGFIEAIIHAANADANRVISFLRQQGVKPLRQSKRPVQSDDVPTGPAADMLLNLAAAIRLRAWELGGLRTYLPADLPTFQSALAVAFECEPSMPSDVAHKQKIQQRVLEVLMSHFALQGQKDLGTDVVLDADGGAEAVRAVAAFLWDKRHLLTKIRREENKNGASNEKKR
jgi:hypothetical protein